MEPKAKSPERVLDKLPECSFFLDEMLRYEQAGVADKFGYCLSAFLSSFRTVTFRLYGVVENTCGKTTAKNLLRQLRAHPDFTDITLSLRNAGILTEVQRARLDVLYRIGNNCAHPKEVVNRHDVEELIRDGRSFAGLIV